HDADDVVDARPGDREARVAGVAGEGDDVGGGGRGRQRREAGAGGHDVARGELGEVEGPREQGGGARVEAALAGGVLHEAGELLDGTRRGELLLRLDAEGPDQDVAEAVEEPDERPEDGREADLQR